MPTSTDERERLLKALALATFIIFFQAYMVAPIIPVLSASFGASVQTVDSDAVASGAQTALLSRIGCVSAQTRPEPIAPNAGAPNHPAVHLK